MTYLLEHELAHSEQSESPGSAASRRGRRRSVADWGADEVFHAPGRHGGREARAQARFADRWRAEHPEPAEAHPLDDWLVTHTRTAEPSAARRPAPAEDPYAGQAAADPEPPVAPASSSPRRVRGAAPAADLIRDWEVHRSATPERGSGEQARGRVGQPIAQVEPKRVAAPIRGRRRPADDWFAPAAPPEIAPVLEDPLPSSVRPATGASAEVAPGRTEHVRDGRRTIVVRGRPEVQVPADARALLVPRRSAGTFDQRLASRPDRVAAWAAVLGFLLILVAVSTADAATLV